MTANAADAFTAHLATELRVRIAELGLSRTAVAEASGIPYRTLKRYLDSEREVPVTALRSLAGALGVSVSDLVEGAERRMHQH